MNYKNNETVTIRLDRFIREKTGISQALIEKSLRKGWIKVNSKRAKADYRLNLNDEIFVSDHLLEIKEQKPARKIFINLKDIQAIKNSIIFEDEELLVLNKPAGFASQAGSHQKYGIDDIVKEIYGLGEAPRIVHRLDKETSGVFLLAKTRLVAQELTNKFQNHEIKKTYIAICYGKLEKTEGEIESHFTKINQVQKITDEGDYALTRYKAIKSKGNYHMVEFYPLTGRMHQIRVHAEALGIPIVGDKKYGRIEIDKILHLHAAEIVVDNEKFKADLPKHMLETINAKL